MSRPMTLRSVDDAWLQEISALRTLNLFAVDLISIPNVEDLFWYVAQNVVGRLRFVDCVIYRANDQQTELQQVAAWGEKNPFGRNIINPLSIPFGRGITGTVAATRRPTIVADLLKEADYIPDTQVARSEICVPLVFRGKVVGVIDSEHPEPNAFGDAELEILTTVAAMTCAKLELLAEAERSQQRYRDLTASHRQLTDEVTARKALESQLFAARKLEALGRMSGRLAHELNNDLTVILGNLELMSLTADPADSAVLRADAMQAAQDSAKLVRNMLAFAQQSRLVPEKLDLGQLAAATLQAARGIDWNLAPDLWPVLADSQAITAVLQHLVDNAHEAGGADRGVTIGARNIHHLLGHDAIAGTDLAPGQYVRLTVSDRGRGIPLEQQPLIFDPFFTTKPRGAGTGMGLSAARGIVQQSGGVLIVQSTPGSGTHAHVILPAVAAGH
jgi:signal transduction histidine kinase